MVSESCQFLISGEVSEFLCSSQMVTMLHMGTLLSI